MQKKHKWRRLPGFRSGARWKAVTAFMVYLGLLIGIAAALFAGTPINDPGEEEAAPAETEAAKDNTALKSCSDFEDDQQLYAYWTEHKFSSENDPGGLDSNHDGVPCAVLSEKMEDEFTAYEKEQTGGASELDIPSYTLHKGENTNYNDTVYVNYYVIPDAAPPSIDETVIDTISDEVIMDIKKKEEFHLLTINFVDAKEAIDYGGYVYGKTDYFPHGDIEAVENDEPGDYSNHEIDTVYGSINNEGLPKQEENYPTDKELDMYFYWAGPAYGQSTDSGNSPVEATADKFNVSKETVEQAVQKASNR
ncbi:hypothetical protein CHL76_09190 [Marinococcus halophilus]|uniref:Uncharacterized protein n=1 Tax=Marinococcus halophilus TaxID=1371 RepID=A0A510Y5A4_MARHA|nr:hypothetical protein [Marinococcus halophilus]OZT80270.1 hypothetical protein CHL76_09190 [Marinococcus halophilus]GEK58333.1 hypothetical protein MHA01_12380 [Marinococcus halophilus]